MRAEANRLVDGLYAAIDDDDLLAVAFCRASFAGCPGVGAMVRDLKDGMTFEINCTEDTCGVTIEVDFDGTRGTATVDEDETELVPRRVLDAADGVWTEDNAIARLVHELTRARRHEAAARVAALEADVTCPHCETVFALRPAVLEPQSF